LSVSDEVAKLHADLYEVREELARTREAFVAEAQHALTLARMLEEKTASLAAARAELARLHKEGA
jgi:hypothetical protein